MHIMEEFNKKFGALMRERRTDKKMTMKELGKLLGVSEQAVWMYENGERSVSLAMYFELSKILGIEEEEVERLTK